MIIKRMTISDFTEYYIASYMEVGDKVEFELVEDSNISIIAHKYDHERTNETLLNLRFVIQSIDGNTILYSLVPLFAFVPPIIYHLWL